MELLSNFREIVLQYFGGLRPILAVLAGVVLLLLFRRKLPGAGRLLLYLALLLLVLNPVSQRLLGKVLQGHLYWRAFWLLPVPILAGVLVTGAAERLRGAAGLIPVLCLGAVLILAGRFVYSDDAFVREDNAFKLPSEAVAVSALMLPEEGETKALVPDDLFCYVRQYSSRIRLLYGRNIAGFTAPVTNERILKIHRLMNESPYPVKKLTSYARKYDCDYLVLLADRPKSKSPEKYGYTYQGTVGHYEVYRDGRTS